MSRAFSLVALLALVPATLPAAQVTGTLDLGAGTYHPDRAIPGGVASIVPSLRYRAGPLDLDFTGTYTDAPAGRWNFQGGTAATVRSPTLGPVHAEVGAHAEWTSHYRVRGTTTLAATGRLYAAPSPAVRLWLGGGAGAASTLGRRRALRRVELGTSASIAGVELGFSLLRSSFALMGEPGQTNTPDSLVEGPTRGDSTQRLRSALTDAVLSGRWRLGGFTFDASVGRRFSRTTPELTLWGVSASRGITPVVDLVAAAGRAGSDPITSVPGARYFALGLRLKVRAGPTPLALVPPAPADRAPFRIGPALGWGREVVVRVPAADAVQLAGDFTDWRPVPLERWGNDAWRAVLAIPAGLHRLAIRIDGGPWQAPPGARPVPSEFGGEVAEIVVE
jgi:hypothetical protein